MSDDDGDSEDELGPETLKELLDLDTAGFLYIIYGWNDGIKDLRVHPNIVDPRELGIEYEPEREANGNPEDGLRNRTEGGEELDNENRNGVHASEENYVRNREKGGKNVEGENEGRNVDEEKTDDVNTNEETKNDDTYSNNSEDKRQMNEVGSKENKGFKHCDSDNDFLGFSPVPDYSFKPRRIYNGERNVRESRPTSDLPYSKLPHCKKSSLPVVVASYGISAIEKILIQKYCLAFGFEYTDSCSKSYSILVFKGTSTVNNLSFKYLVALAAKAKIVNYEWVIHSIRENRALPEDNFLLRDLSFWDPKSEEIPHGIFQGMHIVTELLSSLNYHEPDSIEHLFRVIGANVIPSSEDLWRHKHQPNKFILFLDEKQLGLMLLNTCARYSTLAVNFKWVQDSLRHGRKLPVEKYLSISFPKSAETLALYGVVPEEEDDID